LSDSRWLITQIVLDGEFPLYPLKGKRTEVEMSKRDLRVTFRVSVKELKHIDDLVTKSNMSLSEYLRHASTNRKIKVVDGLPEFSKELRAVGRNLNQLTRLCNQGKITCLDLGGIKRKVAVITEKIIEL